MIIDCHGHYTTAPEALPLFRKAQIAALKNPTDNGWIQVHLSAQLGDWYEIDRASLIDNELPPGGKKVSVRGIEFMEFDEAGLLKDLVIVHNQDDFATQLKQ